VRVRICIIGKFPPIQGGVSMRTYWSAHGLAAVELAPSDAPPGDDWLRLVLERIAR